jgi:CDP-diacylglycerol--serine O-phosphatidyltransferase
MSRVRDALPSALTSLGLSAALASVLCTSRNQHEWAAWLILWSALLDKVDGAIAKKLDATSRFGAELDSLSDFISFGLAPAFLILMAALERARLELSAPTSAAALVAAWFYVLAAGIRLARFNLVEHPAGEHYFQGVPTTSCGILVGAGLAVFFKHRLPDDWLLYAPFVLPFLGLAMLSNLPVPKVVRRRSRLLEWLQKINLVVLPVFCFARIFPEYILALMIIYLVVGVGYGLLQRREEVAKAIDSRTTGC